MVMKVSGTLSNGFTACQFYCKELFAKDGFTIVAAIRKRYDDLKDDAVKDRVCGGLLIICVSGQALFAGLF
jgi:hypothetical protein